MTYRPDAPIAYDQVWSSVGFINDRLSAGRPHINLRMLHWVLYSANPFEVVRLERSLVAEA